MYLFKVSFLGFFKNIKIFLYVFSISIILGIMITILTSNYIIDEIYNNEIKNSISNRTLYVSSTENINISKLKELSNVQNVDYSYSTFEISISYKSYSDKLIAKPIPRALNISNSDEALVIIPLQISEKYKIQLNDTVTIQYQDLSVYARVAEILEEDSLNNIYLSFQLMNQIANYDTTLRNTKSALIVVNDYSNVEKVIQIIQNMNYTSNIYDTSGLANIKNYETISVILFLFIGFIFIFTYILLSIILNNIINDEKNDIAILKAIGYNNRSIIQILILRILSISTLSYLFGFVFSIGIQSILNYIIANIIQIKLNSHFTVIFTYSLISLIILMILSVFSSLRRSKKIENINIITLLKD